MAKDKGPSLAEIKAAILANRGGWETASDAELLDLWNHLDEAARKKYLAKPQEKDDGKK